MDKEYWIKFKTDDLTTVEALLEAGAGKVIIESAEEDETEPLLKVRKKYKKRKVRTPKDEESSDPEDLPSTNEKPQVKGKFWSPDKIQFITDQIALGISNRKVLDSFNAKYGVDKGYGQMMAAYWYERNKLKNSHQTEDGNSDTEETTLPSSEETSDDTDNEEEIEESGTLFKEEKEEKSDKELQDEIKRFIREHKKWDAMRLRNEISQKWGIFWSREKINTIRGM